MDTSWEDNRLKVFISGLFVLAFVLWGISENMPKPNDIPARPPNLPPGDGSNDGWGDPWKKKEPIVPPRILPRPTP